MEVSLIRHFRTIAASVANSTAFRFSTGSAPGIPRHTGQTFVLGGAPKRVEHEQKIFVAVRSCTRTSRPRTGSWAVEAATEVSAVVDISGDYTFFNPDRVWPGIWCLPTRQQMPQTQRRPPRPCLCNA